MEHKKCKIKAYNVTLLTVKVFFFTSVEMCIKLEL